MCRYLGPCCLKSYLYSVNFWPSVSSSGRVHRRIADADIIDLVHDATAKEMSPHDVCQILGKERVLGRSQPFGQHCAAVACPATSGTAPPKNLGGMARPPTK